MEEFDEALGNTLQNVPAHNFLAVLANFNVRLGQEDARYSYHETTNRNMTFLAEILME